MKRKVKKYAGGSTVTSRGGDTNMRTRSDEEFAEDSKFGGYGRYMPKGGSLTRGIKATSRPSEDLAPSEPKSTMDGSTEIKKDTYEEPASRGIASGFNAQQYLEDSGPKGGGSGRTSTISPAKKKKPKPRYSGVVSAEDLGSQDFSSKAKPKPTGDSGLSKAALAAGLGLAGAAGAGLLASRRGMKSGTRGERVEPSMGGTTRSPVRSMTAEEASFENEGGRYFKKGGATKKMASGGKTSSASSRGDGIAQRGKTKGRIC